LVLVVKAFLRQKGLNEVFTGGLSSYCIFLLVLAHLQAERLVPVHGGDPPSRYPPLGLLLWTFFRRFGNQFNYNSQVVRPQHALFVVDGGDYP
jgi:DNA polymerase sigma